MNGATTPNHKPRIIRTLHTADRPYFAMSRAAAQDARLSWEERGMLAYLLSKPDDWQVNVKDLQQNCGRDKVYRILADLEAHGYLTRQVVRDKRQVIRGVEYQVHETPFPEKPQKPLPGLPDTENPDTYIIENLQSTESYMMQTANAAASALPEPPKETKPPETPHRTEQSVTPSLVKKDESNGQTFGKLKKSKLSPADWFAFGQDAARRGKPLADVLFATRSDFTARRHVTDGYRSVTGVCPPNVPEAVHPRAAKPWDVLFDAVATHFFDGARSGRVGWILWGNPKTPCKGLVAFEVGYQGKDREALDYNALAGLVEAFARDFKRANPGLQLRECVKWVERWEGWRRTTAPANGKPKPDPNCPKCHGAGVYRELRDGDDSHTTVLCDCKQEVAHA